MRVPCLLNGSCSATSLSIGASRVTTFAVDSGVIEGVAPYNDRPKKCGRCRRRRCRC